MTEGEAFMINLIHEDVLSVDEEGRVWRHKIRGSKYSNYHSLPEPRRAESPSGNGYLTLNVVERGRKYRCKAHRVIWIYFHGDIDDNLTINHIDSDGTNNHPSNLELVTQAENAQHAFRVGRRCGRPGTKHHNTKLSEGNIAEIRKLYADGMYSQSQIGKMFGIGQTQVGRIIRGERWSCVPFEPTEEGEDNG
jgi:hypothetical protein